MDKDISSLALPLEVSSSRKRGFNYSFGTNEGRERGQTWTDKIVGGKPKRARAESETAKIKQEPQEQELVARQLEPRGH